MGVFSLQVIFFLIPLLTSSGHREAANGHNLEGEPYPGSLHGPRHPTSLGGGPQALVGWGHACLPLRACGGGGSGASASRQEALGPLHSGLNCTFFPDRQDPAVQGRAVWGSPHFPLPAPTLLFGKRNLSQ